MTARRERMLLRLLKEARNALAEECHSYADEIRVNPILADHERVKCRIDRVLKRAEKATTKVRV